MNAIEGAARALAVISGASGGIGEDLAHIFAREGHDLALVARSAGKLEALADAIAATGRPRPLVVTLDLAGEGAADALAAALIEAGATTKILVNNAGYGLAGNVAESDHADQLGIIELNVTALTDITIRLLPDIIANRGRILNVASTAAFFPGPGMAIYYASKAYVLSFSRALEFELRDRGVSVTALCPGPTTTGFQNRAGVDSPLFKKSAAMDSRSVAEAGYKGLMAGKSVVVPGLLNTIMTFLAPIVPAALTMPVIARMQARRKAG